MRKITLLGQCLLFCLISSGISAKECRLEESLPAQAPQTLSNGQSILVPTFSKDFQTLIVFGRMNNDAVEKVLRQNNLYPLQLSFLSKTYAVGALSFFNYRQSDMGSFREIYLVVVASKKKMKALNSIGAIIKAVRPSKVEQESDLVLFHLKAYSSSPLGVLGSRELWKIDSDLAKVETVQVGPWLQFTLNETAVSKFEIDSFTKLPMNSSFNLDAGGPVFEGEQLFSHVLSCSEAGYALFNPKKHQISVVDGLKELMKQFDYSPWFLEYSPRSQAIQF